MSEEARELYLDSGVQEIDVESVTPLTFFRDWVAPNKPVIIKSAITKWNAFKKWNSSYLREKIGEAYVTVAVTPNGYADAPNNSYFVMPEEKKMKFNHFLDILNKEIEEPGIFYVQKQNSNLTDEFRDLLSDVDSEISWFSEALGKSPDAVNFWMGDERSITSMHKDNYENIYCVVNGYKDFILHPPTDAPWIPYKLYPQACYNSDSDGKFTIKPVEDSLYVPWICIDPLHPDFDSYPQYKKAVPIRCRLQAGDALYLPSLWFHHVSQSHGCIAINYWYDMEYDIKYNYYKLVQNLTWNKLLED
ncbi:JmjC domain-containing protein 7, partial [Armadillidium nasatum]